MFQKLLSNVLQKNVQFQYILRPGFVIGKKGADIEKIKKNIMKQSMEMSTLI